MAKKEERLDDYTLTLLKVFYGKGKVQSSNKYGVKLALLKKGVATLRKYCHEIVLKDGFYVMTCKDKQKMAMRFIKKYGSITSIEATNVHRNTRLSSSILSHRKRGVLIETEDIPKVGGGYYGRYSLTFK